MLPVPGTNEAVEETAKAAQEAFKFGSSAVDAATGAGNVLLRFIGGPLDTISGTFDDYLRVRRITNQIALAKKVQTAMLGAGLSVPSRLLDLKFAVPLLQAASLEDEDSMQDRWAALLINAGNAESGKEVKRAHVEILERLTPSEANILDKIYTVPYVDNEVLPGVSTIALPDTAVEYDSKNDNSIYAASLSKDVALALAQLLQLGCITLPPSWEGGQSFKVVYQTILGRDFIKVCTVDK